MTEPESLEDVLVDEAANLFVKQIRAQCKSEMIRIMKSVLLNLRDPENSLNAKAGMEEAFTKIGSALYDLETSSAKGETFLRAYQALKESCFRMSFQI